MSEDSFIDGDLRHPPAALANMEQMELLRGAVGTSRRLHRDAALLIEHGRFQSGFALSLLSIEEIGKLLIELWKYDGFWGEAPFKEAKARELTFHVRKQMAFASVIFAGEVWQAKQQSGGHSMNASEARALYQDVFDRADGSSILVDAMFGILNRDKEKAFYVDLGAQLANMAAVGEAEAKRLLERHSEALDYLREYDLLVLARVLISTES